MEDDWWGEGRAIQGWVEGRYVEGKVCFRMECNGKNRFCGVKMARRGGILLPDLSMDKDGRTICLLNSLGFRRVKKTLKLPKTCDLHPSTQLEHTYPRDAPMKA